MSKRQVCILGQLTGMSIAAVVLIFAMLGYTPYHYRMFESEFENLVSYTAENSQDINDSQTFFSEVISDLQEILAYDDTTIMSVTGINQSNLQAANDEWEEIYNYTDEVRKK